MAIYMYIREKIEIDVLPITTKQFKYSLEKKLLKPTNHN